MFINSGNNKISDPHKLLLSLSDKTAFLLLAKDGKQKFDVKQLKMNKFKLR